MPDATTLHLRCIRCGAWADMDPFDMYGWGMCGACWDKGRELAMAAWQREHSRLRSVPLDERWRFAQAKEFRVWGRWTQRWQRDWERHPTYKALLAAEQQHEQAIEETPW